MKATNTGNNWYAINKLAILSFYMFVYQFRSTNPSVNNDQRNGKKAAKEIVHEFHTSTEVMHTVILKTFSSLFLIPLANKNGR